MSKNYLRNNDKTQRLPEEANPQRIRVPTCNSVVAPKGFSTDMEDWF